MAESVTSLAESLFDQFLAESPDTSGFEAWVAQYPEESVALRQLLDAYECGLFALENDETKRELQQVDIELRPGRMVGEFQLVRRLGRGAQGEVWLAEQAALQRQVALKILRPDRIDSREFQHYLERFRREAAAAASLRHKNIVVVHQAGETDGLPWIAQELIVGGRTLHDLIARHELATLPKYWDRWVASTVAQVAEALAVAHAHGIVHRDVKPTNILMEEHGTPRLGDFGLARVEGEASLTGSKAQVGTLGYMSPEQVSGNSIELGPRTDIFSLGVVLYELLTLQRPFNGDSRSEIEHKIQREDERDPREIRGKIPRDLVVICGKALEKDPRRRYPTASELAVDLRCYLAYEPIHARPPTIRDRALKWLKRNPTKTIVAGIVAVTFAAITWLLVVNVQANRQLGRSAKDLGGERTKLIRANQDLSQMNKALDKQTAEAVRVRDEVLRLSALQDYEGLIAEAERLWPAYPENIEKFITWIDEAEELVAELPVHENTRAQIRSNALPQSKEERMAERESHPDWPRLQAIPAEIEKLSAELVSALTEKEATRLEQDLARLEAGQGELEARVSDRQHWQFPEERAQARWWNNQLTELIAKLRSLNDEQTGLLSTAEDGVSADHGWSVPRRLAFAKRLRDGMGPGGEFEVRWRAALPAIHEKYPGLVLKPQMGLVPIGADPESGLWEFWHVATGDEPLRAKDGKLVLKEEMGLVLVLIPPGAFWIGAQSTDPAGRNYDPLAQEVESPVHEIVLDAYFLSKYEMNQAQWLRLVGRTPSALGPWRHFTSWSQVHDGWSYLQPVEQVSWGDCFIGLGHVGLSLPSEARWERGARGGTESPWWTGKVPESISGAERILCRFESGGGMEEWLALDQAPDDGNTTHADVGSYRANGFGLHDVLGNVCEWCMDGFINYDNQELFEDSERRGVGGTSYRVFRGGSFEDVATHARSAFRGASVDRFRHLALGVRPAKSVQP